MICFNHDDDLVPRWSIFEVETNASAKDMDQAFYAGFVEGFTTKGNNDCRPPLEDTRYSDFTEPGL